MPRVKPKIGPRTIPKNVQNLITTYQNAQLRLIEIIANQTARGNVTSYRKALLDSVYQELEILNEFTAKWAADEIPRSYGIGIDQSLEAFRKSKVEISRVAANQAVLKNLVDNVTGQLQEANMFIGRRLADEIRQAGIEAVSEKVATGSTVKEAKNILLRKLEERGINTIEDAAGRNIRLDAYAEMVARTTTREATNKGAMQQMTDNGYDLVQISQHYSACEICAAYEGRVYSVSGRSTEYPRLDAAFSGGYATIHPNCAHVISGYFPDLDPNADQMKAFSNRPFEVPPGKKASIDAYNRDQKVKSARRRDRNEWEQSKLLAPDKTPKTFSGYRAAKRADSERYQEVRQAVREARKQS